MKPLPSALLPAFHSTLRSSSIADRLWADYEKWLRYYLDFCFKYRHPPHDADSLEPFLQKLASKNQSKPAQEQAAHSISLYYESVRNGPSTQRQATETTSPESAWDSIYRQLKEAIKVRQYSPKTLSAYRIWTAQFQKFIQDKPPGTINADDAARFFLPHA